MGTEWLSSELSVHYGRGCRKENRGWRTPRVQDSASGPPHIILFSLIYLWDFWECKWMGLWFLCLTLGIFSTLLCCFVYPKENSLCFTVLYFIFVTFCCYRVQVCSFSKERQKGSRFRRKRSGEELGGVRAKNL